MDATWKVAEFSNRISTKCEFVFLAACGQHKKMLRLRTDPNPNATRIKKKSLELK